MNTTQIAAYAGGIEYLINAVFVPVLFAIAFLTFLWGVYRYFILGADNEAERTKGKSFVIWGIIGFVVILSVWSLVRIVGNAFGLYAGGSPPSYPTL